MIFGKKLNRWKKSLIVVSIFLLCSVLAIYYIIDYKFKEVLTIIITEESHGRYRLNASDIDFSLWQKKLTVSNASVDAIDTVDATSHYSVSFSKIFLSIESLRDVLFHDRMVVTDVLIDQPFVQVHSHTNDSTRKSVSYQATDVFNVINKISAHLQVRNFKVVNGAVSYTSSDNALPFKADRIDLTISNFRKKNNDTGNLLYTDDVDLSISNQSWIFPSGKQELTFKNFHYSGKNQFVRIDTCALLVKGDEDSDEITLYADELWFTPQQVLNHFKNDELIIDSLLCVRPLLVLHKKNRNANNKTGLITDAIRQVFDKVVLRHIEIIKGAFEIYEPNTSRPSYTTEQADVEIFNMEAIGGQSRALNVDSIKLKINDLSFTTKDSLYEMNVGEFSLKNNDLTFINARFGNAPGNPSPSNLTFSTPTLRFRKIDLEELLKKKLNAPSIEIFQPTFNLFIKPRNLNFAHSTAKFSTKDFYKIIHGVAELINVDSFRIIDGTLHLRSEGDKLSAYLKSINGIVLINDFLESGSLVDVKRAIPDMNIETIFIGTTDLHLTADKFHFNGRLRYSNIDNFKITLNSGNIFSGRDIRMELLDWDVFQKTKVIQMKLMTIAEVIAEIKEPARSDSNLDIERITPDLPVVRIEKLDIGKLGFSMDRGKASLKFNADAISVDSLNTIHRFVEWNKLRGNIGNFNYKKANIEAAFGTIRLNDSREGIMKELRFKSVTPSRNIMLEAPEIKMRFDIHSTDFSKMQINALESDTAVLTIGSPGNKIQGEEDRNNDSDEKEDFASGSDTSATNTTPAKNADIRVAEISFKNTALNYSNSKDSIEAKVSLDFTADSIELSEAFENALTYKHMSMAFQDLLIKKQDMRLSVPALTLDLSEGEITRKAGAGVLVQSGVVLNWEELAMNGGRAGDDSIEISNLSGSYQNQNFKFESGKQLQWWQMSRGLVISGGNIDYKTSKLNAGLKNVSWNGLENTLRTRSFFVTPKLSWQEALRLSPWQKDHVQFEGESAEFKGVEYSHLTGDSMISVSRLTVDNVNLVASRDKRIPFRHDIQKLMPTALIKTIRQPIALDTVMINRSSVRVREISAETKKVGIIPIEDLNGNVVNLTNRPDTGDYLVINMRARILDNTVDKFEYREKYNDPLSNFELRFNTPPLSLQEFSQATLPLANLDVERGRGDTIFARWKGNKYAAIGHMNFYYQGLKVSVKDNINVAKKPLRIRIINFLADIVLRKSNNREAVVFFERDQEKFVFNYWVKTTVSGLMTSVGFRSNKKLLREYNKVKQKYSLP